MKLRDALLVLGGMFAGVVFATTVTTGAAQQKAPSARAAKPYKRLTTPRIPPIDPKDFTDEQRAALGNNQRPNTNLRTALYEPELGKQWWTWLTFLWNSGRRGDAALTFYDKELVILRTNWVCHDDWVWGQHVPIAKRNGRSDADIAKIPKGANAAGWSATDRALLQAVDELHADSFISDATWRTLSANYNTRQLLDLLFTVGNYHLNAFYANSVGMPFEEGFGSLPRGD